MTFEIYSDRCAIWNTPARQFSTNTDTHGYLSPRAGGKYCITGSAKKVVEHWTAEQKILLTKWIVDNGRFVDSFVPLNTFTLEQVERQNRLSAVQRGYRLLEYFAEKTKELGTPIKLGMVDAYESNNPTDNDLGIIRDEMLARTDSATKNELQFLCEYLLSRRWLEQPTGAEHYRLAMAGLAELEVSKNLTAPGKQAFVAMWFNTSMNLVFTDAMEPAIRDAGYQALRIDNKEHNNKIDDEIILEIRRSRFLVADFTHDQTGHRGGVYYEAGLAQGLSLPVIFTCRTDCIKNVHFDTRQYNHIVWDDIPDLRARLSQRISATLGDGPGLKVKA